MVARTDSEPKEKDARGKRARFRLRRGSQFEEALRHGANEETGDEQWLAGLHAELDEEAPSGADAPVHERSSGWGTPPSGTRRAEAGAPGDSGTEGDDLAMFAVELQRLKERLRTAEEAVAEARSVCAASSAVLERIMSRPDQQQRPGLPRAATESHRSRPPG